ISPWPSACTMTSWWWATAWIPARRIGTFGALTPRSTAYCGRADLHPNRNEFKQNKFKRSDEYGGYGPGRFQASIDSAERAASLHGQHGRPAAFVPDAGHDAVEFASQGLPADRGDGLGQM